MLSKLRLLVDCAVVGEIPLYLPCCLKKLIGDPVCHTLVQFDKLYITEYWHGCLETLMHNLHDVTHL